MSPRLLLFLSLVLGLVAGFGAGFIAGSTRSTAATAPGSVMLDAGDGVAGRDGTPGSPSPAADLADVGDLPATPATPGTPSTASSFANDSMRRAAESLGARAAAGAAAGPLERPGWTETISGVVTDENGQAIAGATVLSPNSQRSSQKPIQGESSDEVGRGYQGLDPLEKSLARTALSRMESRQMRRTAETDAEGRFTLTGLRAGEHVLSCYAEGYDFKRKTTAAGTHVSLAGVTVSEFEFDVRLPNGSQPESAVLYASSSSRRVQLAWSPPEPKVRFPGGRLTVAARAGHLRVLETSKIASDFESVPLRLDVETEGQGPHRIELTEARQLRVTLDEGTTGEVRLTPWVKIVPASTGPVDGIQWGDFQIQDLQRVASGEYVVPGLTAGSYVVAAGRADAVAEVVKTVELGEGLTEVELALGVLDPADFTVIHCVDASGRGLSGVRFRAKVRYSEGSRGGQLQATDLGQGRYWVSRAGLRHGYPWSEVEFVELEAESKELGTRFHTLTEAPLSIELTFETPLALSVVLEGEHSPNFTVSVRRIEQVRDGHPVYSDTSTESADAAGYVTFSKLQPGDYDVRVFKGDGSRFSRGGRIVAAQTASFESGQQTLKIQLPTLYTLVVHAPEERKGRDLRLHRLEAGGGMGSMLADAEIQADLRATFVDIPGGVYTLTDGFSREGGMQVTVPSGEVTFVKAQ